MARKSAREAAMSLLYQRIFTERYDIEEFKVWLTASLN